MGTNYYALLDECSECGRYEKVHLGKSSYGWAFSLHVYPQGVGISHDLYIDNYDDWKVELLGEKIVDEYGYFLTRKQFLDIIQCREVRYRQVVDGVHCIGWDDNCDLMVGDFS